MYLSKTYTQVKDLRCNQMLIIHDISAFSSFIDLTHAVNWIIQFNLIKSTATTLHRFSCIRSVQTTRKVLHS